LTVLYAVKGNYDYALCFLKKWMRLQTDPPAVYYLTASIYARKKKAEKAIEMLKMAVARGFSDWEFLKNDTNMDYIKHTTQYRDLIQHHLLSEGKH
jgi:tetratricopeptide (TPR) repeat protein